MSRKTSDVFRAGDITVDGTLNSNESQLIFRAKQKPYNPYSGRYYSLSAAQIDDPTIRLNQYAANGTFESFGYLYDTQFNPLPPGTRITVAGGIGDPTQEPNPSLIYSYDNIHWYPMTNRTNLFQGGGCTALAYNSFIFAAGGSATAVNRMLYSANGMTWIASSSGTALCTNGCNNIASNGGFWIAGTSGTHRLITSFDGINWYATSATNGGADYYLTVSCNAAAWSGSMWLAGGQGTNPIIRSTDGFFWLASDNAMTIFQQCLAVAWNGTFWLAGGIPVNAGQPTIAISYDGITWTPVPITAPAVGTPVYSLSVSCNAIAWSGAQWVIGGQDISGNTLAYSYDGTAWFPGTNSTFIICNAISWDGNSWAAAGLGSNSLVTSFDGVDWTPSEQGNVLLIEGGAVAVNKILPNASSMQQINVIATSAALTLIGASGETLIAFSKDGITWTPSTSATKAFTNGACLALSWNGFVWTAGFTNADTGYTMGNSADGVTWGGNATGSSLLSISCNAIANNESIWVAGGTGSTRLIYSTDSNGITWADVSQSHTIFDASASDHVNPGTCNTVGWNGIQWVAGSDCSNNRLAYSTNGLVWTGSASGNAIFTTSCNSVTWNGLLWIAAGSSGGSSIVAYSYDGQLWSPVTNYGGYTTTGITWNTVACNELLWILGGDVSGSNCILFSYDGMNWNPALGTDALMACCTGVAWNGVVWVATGTGTHSAIYSYNGATWIDSYNGDGIFPTGATAVAANRPQATTGATRPVPTLYAASALYVGAVSYTPLDASLNSLYPSTTLIVDDANHCAGVNRVPVSHPDIGGVTRAPTLDLSGTGIYVQSGGGTASLSLVNPSVTGSMVARIELMDLSANTGWSIDDTSGTNHLQLTSWKNLNPFTVVDIAPAPSALGGGAVDINGMDPLAPNGAALYVNGMANLNQLAVSVHGISYLEETHGTDIYLSNINPNGTPVSLVGTAGVTIGGSVPGGGNLLQANNNQRLVLGSTYTDSSSQYIYWDGTGFFPFPGTTKPAAGYGVGSAVHPWDNLYVSNINPTGMMTQIGGGTGGLTILPNTYDGVTLMNSNQVVFGSPLSSNVAYFNATQSNFGPYPTNQIDLGTPINIWRNLWITAINPTGVGDATVSHLHGTTSINDLSGVTIGGSVPGGGNLLQANNNQRLVLGSTYTDSSSQYIYWDGTGLFPFPGTTKPVAGYGVGSAAHPWDNLYINNLYSPNSMTFYTGGSTQSLTLSSTAVLRGNNTQTLGSIATPWPTTYTTQINPTARTHVGPLVTITTNEQDTSGSWILSTITLEYDSVVYSVTCVLVGGGGGGGAWNNYLQAPWTAGGGAGGYITAITVNNIPAGTVISWYTGYAGSAQTGGIVASQALPFGWTAGQGGLSSVTIPGVGEYIAYGGHPGYSANDTFPVPVSSAIAIRGGGSGVAGAFGYTGADGVADVDYTKALGGAAPFLSYGYGGNGGQNLAYDGGQALVDIKIQATYSIAIPYGFTTIYADKIYVPTGGIIYV